MHPYATDSKERVHVVVMLALLSVAITYGFHAILTKTGVQWPWWLEAPSVWGVFGGLYLWFDKKLWRSKLLRKIGFVKIPDLNGHWVVQGQSTTFKEEFSGEIFIQQTWTHLSVTMETKHSRSHSLTASLLVHQPDGITLSYEYKNEPKHNAPCTMHAHRGTAVLRLKRGYSMDGEYYTGRDRLNFGVLNLESTAKSP